MPTFMPDPEDFTGAPEVTAHGFLASQLTDHIREMPDGTLVVEDCPIARTGWQEYSIRDLPQQRAKDLGIDVSNPSSTIDLYRPPEEVFAPEFMASLEGRPITDSHPPGFVTPENFSQYAKGHIQNVRKGPEALDDGEWPLIADLVISGEPLVSKVRNKMARDVSLGYDYGIKRQGSKVIQCDMAGNHNAIVPKGRAGGLVAIGDHAGESPPAQVSMSIAPPEPARAATSATSTAASTKKESKPVANILRHLIGLGLKSYATDADPEKLAEAAEAIKQTPLGAEDSKGRRARDDEPDEEEELIAEDARKRARDRKRSRDEADIEETYAQDSHRKKMHDALDMMLDDPESEEAEATDADLEELKGLLTQFFNEEEQEPEHQTADADPAELEELLGAGEEPDAEDEELPAEPGEELAPSGEVEPVEDDEELEEEELAPANDRGRARDSRDDRAGAADGVKATLKLMRPAIARCNDEAVKRAFNTAYSTVTRASRASDGGYGAFARTAVARDRAGARPASMARAADAATDKNAKAQAIYDKLAKGGK